MKCSECLRRKKCDLKTPEDVENVEENNRKLLSIVCNASVPRFADDNNLYDNFKKWLDCLFDVISVLYVRPMQQYFPDMQTEKSKLEKDQERFNIYRRFKTISYEESLNRADMRTIALGRASVGLVGKFSSGKSSFLNKEILNGPLLPVDTKASTSIPTYIFFGMQDKLIFENMQGNITIYEGLSELTLLSHSTKPQECPCYFPWSTVIRRIFYFSKQMKYNQEMVYVDLPGYGNNDEDNKLMYKSANGCDKIILFLRITDGDLSTNKSVMSDLDYLANFKNKSILILLSMADKVTLDQANKVKIKVSETLKTKKIEVKGIAFYTDRPNEPQIEAQYRTILKTDLEIIKKFILDKSIKDEDLDYVKYVLQHFIVEFTDYMQDVINGFEKLNSSFKSFLGDKPLDDSFFNLWKRINKDTADSCSSYMGINLDKKLFNPFFLNLRANDYVHANIERLMNYFKNDIYDSNFNNSYQFALLNDARSNIYATALMADLDRTSQNSNSTYISACKFIDSIQTDYNNAKNNIEYLVNIMNAYYELFGNEFKALIDDAMHAFNKTNQAYNDLIQYAKKYEQRWFN